MRAFACALAFSLAGCAAPQAPERLAGPPQRVVSLNLCTDELLLLLAAPEQIASVTHLSHRIQETPLAEAARAYPANDGTVAGTTAMQPDLVLTFGGGGGDRIGIARRMGIAVIDLPYPQRIDDIVEAVRRVAAALGREAAGAALLSRLQAVRVSRPVGGLDALWIGGGGRTVAAEGLEAEWMALAGLEQRSATSGRVELDELLARPPMVLLRSDYRQDQYSRGEAWLGHPLSEQAAAARTIRADGRRWTCLGPLMIDEIVRLRRESAG